MSSCIGCGCPVDFRFIVKLWIWPKMDAWMMWGLVLLLAFKPGCHSYAMLSASLTSFHIVFESLLSPPSMFGFHFVLIWACHTCVCLCASLWWHSFKTFLRLLVKKVNLSGIFFLWWWPCCTLLTFTQTQGYVIESCSNRHQCTFLFLNRKC